MFNIGESAGSSQGWKFVRNLVGNYVTIPSLQGLRKDHKGDMDGDPVKGPKLRPLAAANRAPNAALGNLVAQVTKAIGNNICEKFGGEIISTEELKRNIDEANSKIRKSWKTEREKAESFRKSRRSSKPTMIQERDVLTIFGMDVVTLCTLPSTRRWQKLSREKQSI